MLYDAIYICKCDFEVQDNKSKSNAIKYRQLEWLMYVITNLGRTLQDAKEKFEEKYFINEFGCLRDNLDYTKKQFAESGFPGIEFELEGVSESYDDPESSGFLHQMLTSKIDLRAFNRQTGVVSDFYTARYACFDKPLFPSLRDMSTNDKYAVNGLKEFLQQIFKNENKFLHKVVRINQYNGATQAFYYIQSLIFSLAGSSCGFFAGINNKLEMERLFIYLNHESTNYAIINVSSSDDPSWLFQYHKYLDRCVIVFDGLPSPDWLKNYTDDKFIAAQDIVDKRSNDDSSKWARVLRLLSHRASVINKANVYDPHFDFFEKANSRVIWIGLNSVPDYRDNEEIDNFSQSHNGSFLEIFESCATTDGRLYRAWF